MVNTPSSGRRKSLSVVPRCGTGRSDHEVHATEAFEAPRCPTSHLNIDQYVRLLAGIEAEGGISTLGEISRALPMVERPVSAVFDLCDAGILCVDLGGPLDGNMRVWRIER